MEAVGTPAAYTVATGSSVAAKTTPVVRFLRDGPDKSRKV